MDHGRPKSPFSLEDLMETEEELRAQLKAIEHRCSHWRGASDGSYEMALSDAGWWDVLDKLKRITNGKDDTVGRRNQHQDSQGGRQG